MNFKINLNETLECRFEGQWTQLERIATHGLESGFSGFLSTHEINEFFNEYESEIEDYYYEMYGDAWLKDSGASNCDGLDSMRCYLVYSLVESWCSDKWEQLMVTV